MAARRGRVVLPDTPEWEERIGTFHMLPGARQMIVADIHAVKTSCGFSVPYWLDFIPQREKCSKHGRDSNTYRQAVEGMNSNNPGCCLRGESQAGIQVDSDVE